MLKIEDVVWERNDKGELIPQVVDTAEEINGKIEKVKVIPLTRGERKEMMTKVSDDGNTTRDTDKELVLKHLVDPKFTDEDIEKSPFGIIEVLAITVLQASGLPVGKNVNVKKANKTVETDFQNA